MKKGLVTLLLVFSMLLSGCVNIDSEKDITDDDTTEALFESESGVLSNEGPPSQGLNFESKSNGTCYVTGLGDCSDTDLVIPETSPNGETVVGVAAYAFYNCNTIKSVYLPSTVKSIGDYAFYNCSNCAWELPIYNGVETIGKLAFYNWNQSAQCHCTGLRIPSSVRSIDAGAFAGCEYESFTVDEGNEYYHSSGNCLIETKTKTLVVGGKNSRISEDGSVTKIGDYAFFECERLTDISLRSQIVEIGAWAFSGCKNVTDISSGHGVKRIGDGAFSNCPKLKSMVIYDTVTDLGTCVFQNCSSLYRVDIGKGVTEIGAYTFSGCRSLTEIKGFQNVKVIGNGAFTNCFALTQIQLPEGLEKIYAAAFYGCSSLKSITIPEHVTFPVGTGQMFYNCQTLESITLPDGVTEIGKMCFYACRSLKGFTISSSVTSIGYQAFSWCDSLESLTVESENPVFVSKDGCVIVPATKTLVAIISGAEIPADGSVERLANGVLSFLSGLILPSLRE